MTPNAEHEKSQELAAQAAIAMREGDRAKAQRLYAAAAKLEEEALIKLPDGVPRTKGILAVSLASLLYKAREYNRAEKWIMRAMLADDIFPPARLQLKELLEVVWDERAVDDGREDAARDPAPSAVLEHSESVELRGTLRALHLDKHWLEVMEPTGIRRHFLTRDAVLDNVVGSMVNRKVSVRAHRYFGKPNHFLLDDIEIDKEQA